MIEVGRICVKTAGREAGKYCVVVDVLDDGMVLVTGPKAATHVKRRKCSIHHIEPTPETVKVKKNATDDEVIAAYKQTGVFKKLELKEPNAKDIEKAKDSERKRATAAKTEKKQAKPAEKKDETKVEEKVKKEETPKTEEKKAEPRKEEPQTEKKPAVKKKTKKKAKK